MDSYFSRISFGGNKWERKGDSRKNKLAKVFKSYAAAANRQLDKEKLKDAFVHLDAAMPYRHAEEALRVVGKSEINVNNETELNILVDYAYIKGYGYSI